MPINTLYHTWNLRIRQLRPMERITRLKNLTWLIVGIHQSRSVCLSRIAGKIPGEAKLLSLVQRLSRFLANPMVDVRNWYEPIARSWLEMQAKNLQQVRLIVDGTKVGFTHQLLIVGLAYRKRVYSDRLDLGQSRFEGIAHRRRSWPCWHMLEAFFLAELPFCWSVTANLELWKCFNNWNDGIGITLCAKKVARTFVCLGKRRGEILGVG